MPVIDESIVITRPAGVVFDFLVTARNLPRWDSSVLECAQVGIGAVTVGTRYRGASLVLGHRVGWTTQVTEFVPGARMTSQSVGGSLKFAVCYDVSAAPAGTTVRYRLAAESGLDGTFGRAIEPIVHRGQTKVVRANLDRLASLLAQRAA
jgi:Polyketide cyclase / dehydrase and lipid transport